MFLFQLNLPEKMAFIYLAKKMVTVDDGIVDDYERHLLDIMSNEMQISVNDHSIVFDLEKLASEFQSEFSRKICLVELLSLALVNEDYNQKQKDLLLGLCNFFDISKNNFSELESWVLKMMNLYKEGIELIKS
ncbi:hypothetical protein C0585_01805 [Candidatus Woesearchaeota archaeon]|nr:MAG: hypothetical protein C0585_01805 [Candidatus Woesearchaeota archaeon]